jgi:hypothetical protein
MLLSDFSAICQRQIFQRQIFERQIFQRQTFQRQIFQRQIFQRQFFQRQIFKRQISTPIFCSSSQRHVFDLISVANSSAQKFQNCKKYIWQNFPEIGPRYRSPKAGHSNMDGRLACASAQWPRFVEKAKFWMDVKIEDLKLNSLL